MRYDRQLVLPEIGEIGQRKLAESKVLIVGAGGLGSPIALYLTGAGVGTIGLVDNDLVSITNLQRQVLYSESELGKLKVECARKRLQALNGEINVNSYPMRLMEDNACELISKYDIVVDGCDNFTTRYLINDTCCQLGKVYVYGAICGFEGQVSVFNYSDKTNYRTLYPEQKERSELPPFEGVVGVTPGVVGSVEANEVIKIICGFGEILAGKLWTIDLRTMQTNLILL